MSATLAGGELLNLVGLSTGVVLYAMLFVMVVPIVVYNVRQMKLSEEQR